MKRAIVLGTFDLTHYGHYRKFKLLKELGYHVIVGVTSDSFATSYKRKPILNEFERMETVKHCKWVDETILLNVHYDHTFEVLFTQANVVVHSTDWSNEAYAEQTAISEEWLKEHKIKRLILPYTEGISTTEIIKRCKDAIK